MYRSAVANLCSMCSSFALPPAASQAAHYALTVIRILPKSVSHVLLLRVGGTPNIIMTLAITFDIDLLDIPAPRWAVASMDASKPASMALRSSGGIRCATAHAS
eukprot:1059396-Karenia_brevis.AAC.1